MKSLLELYGQQFRNPMLNSDSQDYNTADVFGQMGANKRRAEYDNSLLGMVHNWATSEQRQPVQLPDDASWMDQAKEAGMRMLNLPNDMAAGGAKTMAHWLGAAGNPEMVEPVDMLAPLGIGAMAGLAGAVPRGAVGSAGGKLADNSLDMSHEARMARAKEMGFDTQAYHASRSPGFDEFDLDKSGWERAVFTSETREIPSDMATRAAVLDEQPAAVMPLLLNTRGFKEVDWPSYNTNPSRSDLHVNGQPYPGTYTGEPSLTNSAYNSYLTRVGLADEMKRAVSSGGGALEAAVAKAQREIDALGGSRWRPFSRQSSPELDAYRAEISELKKLLDERATVEAKKDRWRSEWDQGAMQRLVDDSTSDGVPGITVRNIGEDSAPGTQHLVLDPSRIRSVNAAFDPAKADSSNLLAADQARGSLPGFLAGALDMSPEARMARAKEMGFDTDNILYHGTDKNFEQFSARDPGYGTGQRGVYMTPDKEFANGFANMDGGRVLPLLVNGKIAPTSVYHQVWDELYDASGGRLKGSQLTRATQEEMSRRGYSGIQSDSDILGREVVIWDPRNIRSVNAAFDPAKADSANLLAADQARGSMPGLLAGAVDDKPDDELMRLLQQYGMMP